MTNQITFADVANAAEQLKSLGRPIGPTKIREHLGRGSFTTVQKYLTEWETLEAQRKAEADIEKKAGPPEELAAELQKMMASYWPHAVARAKEQMRPDLEALEAQVLDQTSRLKEATLEIGNLENKLEAAANKASRMEEAEKKAAEANQRIITLQNELARLEKIEARFEGQTQLIANLETQNSQLKVLLAENADLRKTTETRTSELNDARIQIAKLETRLEVQGKK
jgi:DNA repair exonuclease SbcCD ATPase subunit